jgi:hypothetical protein
MPPFDNTGQPWPVARKTTQMGTTSTVGSVTSAPTLVPISSSEEEEPVLNLNTDGKGKITETPRKLKYLPPKKLVQLPLPASKRHTPKLKRFNRTNTNTQKDVKQQRKALQPPTPPTRVLVTTPVPRPYRVLQLPDLDASLPLTPAPTQPAQAQLKQPPPPPAIDTSSSDDPSTHQQLNASGRASPPKINTMQDSTSPDSSNETIQSEQNQRMSPAAAITDADRIDIDSAYENPTHPRNKKQESTELPSDQAIRDLFKKVRTDVANTQAKIAASQKPITEAMIHQVMSDIENTGRQRQVKTPSTTPTTSDGENDENPTSNPEATTETEHLGKKSVAFSDKKGLPLCQDNDGHRWKTNKRYENQKSTRKHIPFSDDSSKSKSANVIKQQ